MGLVCTIRTLSCDVSWIMLGGTRSRCINEIGRLSGTAVPSFLPLGRELQYKRKRFFPTQQGQLPLPKIVRTQQIFGPNIGWRVDNSRTERHRDAVAGDGYDA